MAEALELKPCPFCGQQPTFTSRRIETGAGDFARHFLIECPGHDDMAVRAEGLGPHGYPQPDDPPSDDSARARVIEAWNRRSEPEALHPPEALEGLIERLRNAAGDLEPLTGYGEDAIWRPANRAWVATTTVANALESRINLLGEIEKALEEIARIRTELRGDFSLSSKQSDIARSALNKLRKGMG